METPSQNKPLRILKLVIWIIIFGVLGWIYFMGIACPTFAPPFDSIYRGVGCGMVYPLFFLLIPAYIKKFFPGIRYAGMIVSIASFILTVVLLFLLFPLQT